MPQKRAALSLFWRTFFLLALLLASGVFAWVQTFRATVAYPYDNQDHATAALRGALRLKVPAEPGPDWSTLQVTGPEELIDARGNVWFEYRGEVACL